MTCGFQARCKRRFRGVFDAEPKLRLTFTTSLPAPTDLVTVERRILHYSSQLSNPPPPTSRRWSEGFCTTTRLDFAHPSQPLTVDQWTLHQFHARVAWL